MMVVICLTIQFTWVVKNCSKEIMSNSLVICIFCLPYFIREEQRCSSDRKKYMLQSVLHLHMVYLSLHPSLFNKNRYICRTIWLISSVFKEAECVQEFCGTPFR